MKKEIIKLDRKEQILSMFHRTIVSQRPKVESNKKIYKRQKYKYEEI
jgi:hypothetical protein